MDRNGNFQSMGDMWRRSARASSSFPDNAQDMKISDALKMIKTFKEEYPDLWEKLNTREGAISHDALFAGEEWAEMEGQSDE
jgi:hypothetical protein